MIRNAAMTDVSQMHRLITEHAELDRMLFRSFADLYEHLRDFFVWVEPQAGRFVLVKKFGIRLHSGAT